ncbi:MAG: hypothetical protein Q8M37_01700 [Nevskia sp.]|nr:hypothetical protein [Nevskia sp.]
MTRLLVSRAVRQAQAALDAEVGGSQRKRAELFGRHGAKISTHPDPFIALHLTGRPFPRTNEIFV